MDKVEKKALLFIDLNGTINRSKSGETFIKDEDDIELIEGVAEVIKAYQEAGYYVLIITNQGGIAYGYKDEKTIVGEIRKTVDFLVKEGVDGEHLDCIFIPYQNTGKGDVWDYDSRTRKPYIGVLGNIEQVCRFSSYPNHILIDYDKSLMVGDRMEDGLFAINANIHFLSAETFLKRGVEHLTKKVDDEIFCVYLMEHIQKAQDKLASILKANPDFTFQKEPQSQMADGVINEIDKTSGKYRKLDLKGLESALKNHLNSSNASENSPSFEKIDLLNLEDNPNLDEDFKQKEDE